MNRFLSDGHERHVQGLREELQEKLAAMQGQLDAAESAEVRAGLRVAIKELKREYKARIRRAGDCLYFAPRG